MLREDSNHIGEHAHGLSETLLPREENCWLLVAAAATETGRYRLPVSFGTGGIDGVENPKPTGRILPTPTAHSGTENKAVTGPLS